MLQVSGWHRRLAPVRLGPGGQRAFLPADRNPIEVATTFTRKIRRFYRPRNVARPDSARDKSAEPAFPLLPVLLPGNHLRCIPNKKSIPANEAGPDNKSRFQFHCGSDAPSNRLAPPLE